MKRIPGIKPRFEQCRIVRPDGSVLEGWEMYIGERSYGRSDSKEALLAAWEAKLVEAESARPFAFRPLRKRTQAPGREGAKRSAEQTERPAPAARASRGHGAAAARKRSRG